MFLKSLCHKGVEKEIFLNPNPSYAKVISRSAKFTIDLGPYQQCRLAGNYCLAITLHLNRKNLSNNSPWDFDTVLDAIDPN